MLLGSMDSSGFEPEASRMQGGRSTGLIYEPVTGILNARVQVAIRTPEVLALVCNPGFFYETSK